MKKVMFALFITFVIGAGIVLNIIMPKRFNDSNGSMYISGGNIIVQGPDEGPNRVLETDTNLTITGVTIIGTECCKKPTVITESK